MHPPTHVLAGLLLRSFGPLIVLLGSCAGPGQAADLSATPDLASPDLAAPDLAPAGTLFAYVGTGTGQLLTYRVDAAEGTLTPAGLVPAGQNPSFWAFDPARDLAYAVEENGGAAQAFSLTPVSGAATSLGRLTGIGAGPVHIVLDAPRAHALIANYTGGTVAVLALNSDGKLDRVLDNRATGALAHCVRIDPSGHFVLVANKGADTISQFRYDATGGVLTANQPAQVATAHGAGPRHIDFHPTGRFAFVINETDSTLVSYSMSAGGALAPVQTVSTLPAGVSGAMNTGAEIQVAPSGRFVYGSNRGHDSIVTFAIDDQTGRLTLVGHTPTGGAQPRHFSLSQGGDLLLAANQGSDTVVLFRIDPKSGSPVPIGSAAAPGGPAWAGLVRLP